MRSEFARPRVIDVVPGAARTYVSEQHDDEDEDELPMPRREWLHTAATLEEIGAAIGCTGERARQIELVALEKLRVGFEIEARLGAAGAAPVLAQLRGQPLEAFREALADVQDGADLSRRSPRSRRWAPYPRPSAPEEEPPEPPPDEPPPEPPG